MNFKANILVETEGLSKEAWLNYRRMGIGGSDVAALLGISKWKSGLDLWLEKTGQTDGLVAENEAMQWGTIQEIERYHALEERAQKVIHLQENYSSGCYYRRNRYMVDSSSFCICYQYRSSGGTAYTTQYAAGKGVEVSNVCYSGGS